MQISQVIGISNIVGDEHIKGTSAKSIHLRHDNHSFLLMNQYRTTYLKLIFIV